MTALAAAWVPRFVYGTPTTLTMTVPMGPATPFTYTVAGSSGLETSQSGLPSAWAGTRLHGAKLKVRGTEAEWSTFRSFLVWALDHAATAFTVYPDTTVGTSHSCYLLAPTAADRVEMPALGAGLLWEYEIEVRRTDGAAIDIAYYGLP